MLANRLMSSDTASMLSTKWSTIGNTLPTDGTTYFLGSSNNQPLLFKVNKLWAGELNPSTTNTSFGVYAGQNNSDPFGHNSAYGVGALNANNTGTDNTAIGYAALNKNTTGINNTAVGQNALLNNSTANSNTAVGQESLKNNTTGKNNTGIGYNTLINNATTDNNTAIGYNAGVSTDGLTNTTAIGYNASVTTSNTIQLGNSSITDVKTSGAITTTSSINAAKIIGNSTAPVVTIVGSAQAGTGASVSISGNDVAGVITLNVGTVPAAGAGSGGSSLITVSFNSAYANAPVVLIQPVNTISGSTGPDTNLFVKPSATTASAFTIVLKSSIALTDSGTYEIAYHVLGR